MVSFRSRSSEKRGHLGTDGSTRWVFRPSSSLPYGNLCHLGPAKSLSSDNLGPASMT